MNNAKMKSELDRANAALVEKIQMQPFIRLDLALTDSGKWIVGRAYIDRDMKVCIHSGLFETPEEAFEDIFEVIAAIPDPEAEAKRNWQGKLGKVIDEGHALGLPDEVMGPLRHGSQVMTENLLAAPKVTP